MKQETDFLFVYEIKNRELESICLLKYELERRGYTVELVETWHGLHYVCPPKKAKVVVSFALYGDGQVEFLKLYAAHLKKIVNMQWEQLYSISDEECSTGSYVITGKAKEAVHISWGHFNFDRLTTKCNIPERNVCLAGHVGLDFLSSAMEGFYVDKSTLCRQFGLDSKRMIYLYISSFSYVDMPDDELNLECYKASAVSANEFKNISIRSQKETLEWIDAALADAPDVEFVYRPHPAEVGNADLIQFEKAHSNFHIIRDLSVKQWIAVADKIYTWYSTSITEVYAAKKACSVLRPESIPREMDIRIYENCDVVKTQERFLEEFYKPAVFPLDTGLLSYYYHFSQDCSAYQTVCDKLIEVLGDDSYAFCFAEKESRLRYIKRYLSGFVHRMLAGAWSKQARWLRLLSAHSGRVRQTAEHDAFVEQMIRNNYSTPEEIAAIQQHIAETFCESSKSDKEKT